MFNRYPKSVNIMNKLPRMVKDLVNVDSLNWVNLEHSSDEVLSVIRQRRRHVKVALCNLIAK